MKYAKVFVLSPPRQDRHLQVKVVYFYKFEYVMLPHWPTMQDHHLFALNILNNPAAVPMLHTNSVTGNGISFT